MKRSKCKRVENSDNFSPQNYIKGAVLEGSTEEDSVNRYLEDLSNAEVGLSKSNRDNHYFRKIKTKQKLQKLKNNHVYFVSTKTLVNGKSYNRRLYLSGCRKISKKATNKKIRKSKTDFSLTGCAYRRKFDYWNTLF